MHPHPFFRFAPSFTSLLFVAVRLAFPLIACWHFSSVVHEFIQSSFGTFFLCCNVLCVHTCKVGWLHVARVWCPHFFLSFSSHQRKSPVDFSFRLLSLSRVHFLLRFVTHWERERERGVKSLLCFSPKSASSRSFPPSWQLG